MLAVIMLYVVIGLLTPRFEARIYWVIGAVASTMTGLYFFATRFMT